MQLTKEFLEKKLRACRQAEEENLANAHANAGAAQILEALLKELEKPEEVKQP